MRERAAVRDGVLVQGKVQGRVLHIKLRVTGPYLAGFNANLFAIKSDAPRHVRYVQGQVRF